MAKKTNSSNFINFMRSSERISENVILGGNSWDYSYIIFISGCMPEVSTKFDELGKSRRFASWLGGEVIKRIYRYRFSRCKDDLHKYIKDFLSDHQERKLKTWILHQVDASNDWLNVRTNLLGRYA